MKLLSKSHPSFTEELLPRATLQFPDERHDNNHLHECPVCGEGHFVNQARHTMAYGRQLTCSYECERLKRIRRMYP
jgi:hypothetical protein